MTNPKNPNDLLKTGPKGPSKYKEDMCKTVLACGVKGMSLTEIAVELGVNRDTVYDWKRKYREFSDAVMYANELAQAWWERQGREGLYTTTEILYDKDTGKKIGTTTRRINSQMWSLQVRNRFPEYYRESARLEHHHAGKVEHEMTHDLDEVRDLLEVENRP